MQKTTLKVTMENGKVLSDMGLILPCALEEVGCETTSLDLTPTSGITLTIVCFPFFEQKKSTWLNRTQNTTSLVEKTLRPNSCLKSKIFHKNIAGNPHLFIRQTTTRFIWLDSVKGSTWTVEQILAMRRMVPPKSFST